MKFATAIVLSLAVILGATEAKPQRRMIRTRGTPGGPTAVPHVGTTGGLAPQQPPTSIATAKAKLHAAECNPVKEKLSAGAVKLMKYDDKTILAYICNPVHRTNMIKQKKATEKDVASAGNSGNSCKVTLDSLILNAQKQHNHHTNMSSVKACQKHIAGQLSYLRALVQDHSKGGRALEETEAPTTSNDDATYDTVARITDDYTTQETEAPTTSNDDATQETVARTAYAFIEETEAPTASDDDAASAAPTTSDDDTAQDVKNDADDVKDDVEQAKKLKKYIHTATGGDTEAEADLGDEILEGLGEAADVVADYWWVALF